MDIKKKFGKKVKLLRIEKGWSQEKLALNADLDRTYIPSIEKGDRNVSITVIEKIADALKLSISDLFKNSSIYFTKDLFSCSICLNETKDNIIRKLICSHNFHINCIETWLSNNTSCPICRYKLI
jgi:transcriptional regulator with XRE-family HTH domain